MLGVPSSTVFSVGVFDTGAGRHSQQRPQTDRLPFSDRPSRDCLTAFRATPTPRWAYAVVESGCMCVAAAPVTRAGASGAGSRSIGPCNSVPWWRQWWWCGLSKTRPCARVCVRGQQHIDARPQGGGQGQQQQQQQQQQCARTAATRVACMRGARDQGGVVCDFARVT
jgi:hypothetical protein